MAMSKVWFVKSESTGKCFGPFRSADHASRWATKYITNAWVIVRLHRPD